MKSPIQNETLGFGRQNKNDGRYIGTAFIVYSICFYFAGRLNFSKKLDKV